VFQKEKFKKFFFATDIHGSETCWRKLVNAGNFYNVDTIILGGDIAGKGTQLILEEKPGIWVTDFLGADIRAEDKETLFKLESRIRNAGFYPYIASPVEFTVFSSSAEYRDQIFQKVVTKSIHQWIDYAEQKLKDSGRRILVTAGNDDPEFIDDLFQHSDIIQWAERKIVLLDENHEILNEGYSNHTPWNTHRELDEDRLLEVLITQAKQLKDVTNAIFNIHVPPYNSQIDSAPLMDAQLRPVDGGQTRVPVGSTAVRKLIEQYQPMLGLHGHIHEAKGSTKIGRTICINPGSTYGEGYLSGVLINLDKKGVRSFQPVQG
jgi:Icc-related predicted phosphoesterase